MPDGGVEELLVAVGHGVKGNLSQRKRTLFLRDSGDAEQFHEHA